MYHDLRNSGVFNATAGTFVFAANGDGNAFNSPGTNQFFNVVVSAPSFQFDSNITADIRVRGDWTMNGTADLSVNKVTTVTFNGSGAQTIGGANATAFGNLIADKPAGAATLAISATVKGNVTVSSGTLDLSSFVMPRTALGGALTVSNGAFLRMGGTNSFPALYLVHNLGATSTVDYNGTSQTVSSEDYGHLNLSGSGTKTMPGSPLTTEGNFTMSGTASATAAAALVGEWQLHGGFGHHVRGRVVQPQPQGKLQQQRHVQRGHEHVHAQRHQRPDDRRLDPTTFNALTIDNSSGLSLSAVNTTVGTLSRCTSGGVTTGAGQFIATLVDRQRTAGGGHMSATSRNISSRPVARAPTLRDRGHHSVTRRSPGVRATSRWPANATG